MLNAENPTEAKRTIEKVQMIQMGQKEEERRYLKGL